jgi:hypothetical protein
MHKQELISPGAIPPLHPFFLNLQQVKGMLVCLCGKLQLMAPSKRKLDHAKPGTNCLPAVKSALMEHLHIKEETNMRVSIDNYFIVLVFVRILTQVSLSHSSFSSSVCPLPHMFSFFSPTFPIPKEKGKPNIGPTYYSFASRHHYHGPLVELVTPSATQDHPFGPPLKFPSGSIQNWSMDNQPMAYVEEQIPHEPPIEPTNNFLFFASHILTPPLTFGHPPLEYDLDKDLGSFPIEENFPTNVTQEETIHPEDDSPPLVSFVPSSPRSCRLS